MKKTLKRVAITGGAGQISYNLLFRIASGEMLGHDQPIALHILEVNEVIPALKGIVMELEDGAYPLLEEIRIGSDPNVVFEGINLAILIGAKPRGPGMERKDLLLDNGKIFVEQGKALDRVAAEDVSILVVGNPCNTNCLIAMHHAPSIPQERFYAMMRLDQNRATFQLARKANAHVSEVEGTLIWGNHSSTQVPDFLNVHIMKKPAAQVIHDRDWLENTFFQEIQQRGASIISARGKSSAGSASQAIIDTVQDLFPLKKEEKRFSLAVTSHHNPYGIREDLIFSFPCRSKGEGRWRVEEGLKFDDFLRDKLKITENELIAERDMVKDLLR